MIRDGDAGLTLRKLADLSGMRLSNVQYYFKTRDDVLTAMIARYFEQCTANLRHLTEESPARTRYARVAYLIRAGLAHGQEISDMCRAFREIWAISSRNDVIDACLLDYYRTFADVMADFAFGEEMDEAGRARLKVLLLPYFEGYSVTARALPHDFEETVEMLTDLVLRTP